MTLENAIELIKLEYEKATDSNYVRNPLAYALYQVWKKADRQISIEPKGTDLTDKCGSCGWAMPIKGSTKGVFGCYIECQNPNKVWKYNSSSRKQRTNPKCRLWQPKEKGGAEETPKRRFTPEDVQKMTRTEVRENYTSIINSMKEWN